MKVLKILGLMVMLILLSTSLYARDLIIAGIPEEPNRWKDKDGKIVGVDIDIIDYIMKKIGVPYKIILEESSARLEKTWKDDKPGYDIVFTYSKTAEREPFLYYPNESHITFSWNFFIRKADESKYKYEKFEDLKGVKIGVTKDISYTDEFLKAGKEGILTFEEVVKNDLQLEKLMNDRIDMVPLNTQATLYELKLKGKSDKVTYLPKALKSKPYFNTFVKKSDYPNLVEIEKKYDEVLKQMKSDGTLKKILEKYGM